MNFDLGLAKERSQKNPVYYVQYAYARVCSIQRVQSEEGLGSDKKTDLSLLVHEKELSLIKELDKFPRLIEEITESYEVHKLPHFAIKLADKFHSFYGACKVMDSENVELSLARLALVNAFGIVMKETLDLIGVEAPEKM
jgi:arginyl-tRNA synthetase